MDYLTIYVVLGFFTNQRKMDYLIAIHIFFFSYIDHLN